MSRSHSILNRALAGVPTLPLVLCSLFSWSAPTDVASASMEVVDTFVAARAARDLEAVAALFQAHAMVMDTGRDLATGIDGVYQLMPLGERLEVGSRFLEANGDVTWSEMVLDNTRPSWENNPNWWIDGNPAVQALQRTPLPVETSGTHPSVEDPARTGYTRMMRVTVTQGRITRLVSNRTDGLSVPVADAWAPRALALTAAVVVLGYVLLGPFSVSAPRTASNRGWLMLGLQRWQADRSAPRPPDRVTSMTLARMARRTARRWRGQD